MHEQKRGKADCQDIHLEHVNSSFSASFMLVREVSNDKVEVLLKALVSHRVVQQELKQH